MNKIKKIFLLIFVFTSVIFNLTAQEEEIPPEIQMELEDMEEAEKLDKEKLPSELQNLIIVEQVHPHELNPQITNYASDSQILSGLYEGLFSFNPVTLEPQYAIAESFNISRDKKRWQITIRDNAYFSNGEKITAQAVCDSFIQMLSTPQAPYASLLDIIRGAEAFRLGKGSREDVGIYATSEKTVSIYLNTPANYLPKILCHSAFSIIHRNPTVYSGAFQLEDYSQNQYVLTKNPYYWDKNNVSLEKITFLQIEDKKESAYLFNTGAVDWICSDTGDNAILDTKAIQFNAEFGTGFLYFNLKGNSVSNKTSFWDLPEFRAAVLEAFPWEIARKTFYIPATTLVYPLSGYPQVQGFMFTDAIEASYLMKTAREKYNVPEDLRISLVMDIFEHEFNDEQKTAMVEALEPLGIELTIRELPSAYYYALINQSDADMFITSWIGDFADPLAFLELFRGDSTMNNSGWKNAEFDALLEKAAVVDEQERYNLLAQAEDLLMSSSMVLPLNRVLTINIIDLNEIGGWAANAFDIHPLKYIYKKVEKVNIPNVVLK